MATPMSPSPTPSGPSFVARARKFLTAAAGVLAMVVATGVLEEELEVWVNAVLAVLTALGVYGVRNETGPATHDDNLRAGA